MDDIVRQAMAKWPNVPHCYGWLGLDERGNWYMRDDRVQAAGPFSEVRGSLLRHEKLVDFIQRNYDCDAEGQWYFQNGPQRVYVELEYTPLIVRLARDAAGALTLTDQTGQPFEPSAVHVDEAGSVLFANASASIALLHDHDLDLFADHAALAEDGQGGAFMWRDETTLPLEPVLREQVPACFGFIASPAREEARAR